MLKSLSVVNVAYAAVFDALVNLNYWPVQDEGAIIALGLNHFFVLILVVALIVIIVLIVIITRVVLGKWLLKRLLVLLLFLVILVLDTRHFH